MEPSSLGSQEAKSELHFPDFWVRSECEVQCSMRLWANWAELPKVQRHWLDWTITGDISVLLGLPPTGQPNGINTKGHHSHCSLSECVPRTVRCVACLLCTGPGNFFLTHAGFARSLPGHQDCLHHLRHLPFILWGGGARL